MSDAVTNAPIAGAVKLTNSLDTFVSTVHTYHFYSS